MTNAFAVEEKSRPGPVGKFHFSLTEETWQWSAEVSALHGYTAQRMAPSTATVLSHIHQADRGNAFAAMAKMAEATSPTSRKLRLVDLGGATKHIVLVGSRANSSSGRELRTSGLYIDISDPYRNEIDDAVSAHRHGTNGPEARIDQATGMLMLMYGLPAPRARDLLSWRSEETNVDIADIAERLIRSVGHDAVVAAQDQRERFDHLLLTAHAMQSGSVHC